MRYGHGLTVPRQPRYRAAAGDPSFSSVVLLCHFDGSNGQTTTTDSSSSAHALTMSGSSKLDSAQAKFGATSLNVGSGTSNVNAADSADWDFGSGAFTVETWVYLTSTFSDRRVFVGQAQPGSIAWLFGTDGSGNLALIYTTDGSTQTTISGGWTKTLNTWMHLAVDRDSSGNVRLYQDGVVKVGPTAANVTIYNSNYSLQVGNNVVYSFGTIPGYLDDMRITKGVCRYGGAFTPPASAFPNQ